MFEYVVELTCSDAFNVIDAVVSVRIRCNI